MDRAELERRGREWATAMTQQSSSSQENPSWEARCRAYLGRCERMLMWTLLLPLTYLMTKLYWERNSIQHDCCHEGPFEI